MLDVDQYLQIRLLHRDGQSIRQIAKRLGHSRDTVKKALIEPTPRGYTRTSPASCPKLGPFIGQIDQILVEDVSAPRKQRHTAARIFARLRDEHGYAGGYDQVRRYVSGRRKKERETHLLLDHPPGGRLECDFGQIHVDFPEGRRLVPVLLAVWSYSHYPFAIALPDQTTGSILHGLVCAFEFFGCVPAELWWDNPKTVATAILRGRDRQLNVHYASLASHYRFAPMFCMPARGQEKGDVERTVFALERRFATPVPSVRDVDELNRHLLSCCLKERQRTVRGRSQTIGQMFEEERRHAIELPKHPFDAAVQHIRQADKYQTVLFEEVRYSVPRQVAFEPVTVKAYVEQIVLVHKGQVVASHSRSRTAGEQVLDPMHFTAVLQRKPAYLDHTKLFKELKLPAAFTRLRDRLEKELGIRTGTRHYIRVLQLLNCHQAQEIAAAIEAVLGRQVLRAEFVEQKLAEQMQQQSPTAMGSHPSDVSTIIPLPARTFDPSQIRHSTGPSADPFHASIADAITPPGVSRPALSDKSSHDDPPPPASRPPAFVVNTSADHRRDVTFHVSDARAIRLPTVLVSPPDLRRFDQLLICRRGQSPGDCSQTQGEDRVRDVTQAQPQDPAAADDAGRVRQALA
jgi:transposase